MTTLGASVYKITQAPAFSVEKVASLEGAFEVVLYYLKNAGVLYKICQLFTHSSFWKNAVSGWGYPFLFSLFYRFFPLVCRNSGIQSPVPVLWIATQLLALSFYGALAF